MGMGDVKLAAVMGLFLGRAVGPAMFVALIAARSSARSSSPARVPRRAQDRDPLRPYLALGGVVGLFAGDAIVDWYLDTFA
jgi:leader peptidase (prepilin peptidase)/N-methyltransferase